MDRLGAKKNILIVQHRQQHEARWKAEDILEAKRSEYNLWKNSLEKVRGEMAALVDKEDPEEVKSRAAELHAQYAELMKNKVDPVPTSVGVGGRSRGWYEEPYFKNGVFCDPNPQ